MTMANDCMLSTIDNPFDPFEQFTSWFMFDVEKGYYSCSRLARIAKFSDEMTQKEIDDENERAIDEIIKYDFTNTYIKVTRKTVENVHDDLNKDKLDTEVD
jgi:hypothetical protein